MNTGKAPFWNLGVGEDDDTAARCASSSTANAPSELDFFAEFFGPLSPAGGAELHLYSNPAGSDGGGAGCSGHAEKGSSSDTKSGSAGGPPNQEEGVGKSEQMPRKRKRSRTSEMHNLTERRRRDRINGKFKTLQELVPNAQKLDKACLLDEAIAYIKHLQQQLQILSSRHRICAAPPPQPPPPLPTVLPHSLSLFPAPPAALNLGMGLMPAPPMPPPACSACNPTIIPPPPPPPPPPSSYMVSHLQPPMAAAMRYYYSGINYASQGHQRPSSATVSSQALQEFFHSADRAASSSSVQE